MEKKRKESGPKTKQTYCKPCICSNHDRLCFYCRDSNYVWDSVVTVEDEDELAEIQLMFGTVWLPWRTRMILPRDSLCLRQCGYYCRYSAYKCGYYYRYSAYAWDSVVTIADIQLLSVVTITDI